MTYEPSTISGLLVYDYDGPTLDNNNSEIAVIDRMDNYRISSANPTEAAPLAGKVLGLGYCLGKDKEDPPSARDLRPSPPYRRPRWTPTRSIPTGRRGYPR